MKKIIFILNIFVIQEIVFSQIKVTSFNPSTYITYGSYSNNDISKSLSFYGTASFNYKDYLTVGYEGLSIDDESWTYDQRMISLSFTKNLYPFYLSASYSYLEGDYNYKPFLYKYSDFINIYSLRGTYNFGLNFLALSANYQNIIGFYDLIARNYKLSFTRLLGTKISLTAGLNNSVVSDGRNLLSYEISGSYNPFNSLYLTASISFGERAYYYNSDLLTYFNQNETQKRNYNLGISYFIINELKINGTFTSSKFKGYSINYYSLGVSYYL